MLMRRRSLHHASCSFAPRLSRPIYRVRAVKLLDQLRERVRMLHCSRRTEQAYLYWSRAFIRFHGLRHPAEMGSPEVEAFLTYLASDRGLSPSSRRQALSALLVFYGQVLGLQLPWMQESGRPVPKRRLPVALSVDDVLSVLARLQGEHQLLARLLYGTGLRITEPLVNSRNQPEAFVAPRPAGLQRLQSFASPNSTPASCRSTQT